MGVATVGLVVLAVVLMGAPMPSFLHPMSTSIGTSPPRIDSRPSALVGTSQTGGSLGVAIETTLLDASMAYDAHDGVMVAVAESLSSSGSAQAPLETWTYQSGAWTELAVASSPSGRIGASLVYDPLTQAVLLFGGMGPSGYLSDTWSFSGGNWTNLTATVGTAPTARASAPFVWDLEDSAGVLYGGVGARGTNWSDPSSGNTSTWLFGAGGWTSVQQNSSTVPGVLGSLAYDTIDGYVVDFGGISTAAPCAASASTWRFVHGIWTDLSSTVTGAPPARWSGAAAYDGSTSSVLVFGGRDCLSYRSDSWSYAANRWTELSAGTAPAARASPLLAYDGATSSEVLFGGLGLNGAFSDTWELGAGGWVLRGPVLSITGGFPMGPDSATDAGANLTIAVVGAFAVGASMYSYSGLPPGCVSVDAPAFRCAATQTGTYEITGGVSSSTGTAAYPAVAISVNRPPSFRSIVLSATATETGVPVTIRAQVIDGTGNYSFLYSGLPPGCASQNVAALTCDPTQAGSYDVGISASDRVGVAATAVEPLFVGPHPFVDSVAASRAVVDVGLSTELSVVAGGGVGPLAFDYAGLPTGCVSSNVTLLNCAPTTEGTFTVHVTAADQFGYAASGSVSVTVHPMLSASSFVANQSTVDLGAGVSFAASVAGGTAPYREVYSGLPTGCSGSDSPTLSCSPRSTGHFTVRLTVVDALGESATAQVTIVVELARSPGPSPPTPVSTSGPPAAFWFALTGTALIAMAIGAAAFGLMVRRTRRFAREGRAIVRRLLDEAPDLGAEIGPLEDPNWPR